MLLLPFATCLERCSYYSPCCVFDSINFWPQLCGEAEHGMLCYAFGAPNPYALPPVQFGASYVSKSLFVISDNLMLLAQHTIGGLKNTHTRKIAFN